MIDLTVARIAEIVGGRLCDISPAEAETTHVTGTVEFDSRAVNPRRTVPGVAGARSDGLTISPRRGGVRRGCGAGARPVGFRRSSSRRRRRRCAGRPARARRRWIRSRGSLAALGRLAGAVAADLTARFADRRDHRVLRQDLDQDPSPPCFGRWARWSHRRACSTTNRAAPDGVASRRGTDFPRSGDVGAPPRQYRGLAAIALPSIAAVLNVGTAHLGEFGSREAIAETKVNWSKRLGPSGVAILNADDAAVAAMASCTSARVVTVGVPRPPRSGRMTSYSMSLARLHPACPAGSVHVQLAVHGEHQVGNARPPPRWGWSAARACSRSRPRWPAPPRRPGTGWRW